jgi:hypothetical protein
MALGAADTTWIKWRHLGTLHWLLVELCFASSMSKSLGFGSKSMTVNAQSHQLVNSGSHLDANEEAQPMPKVCTIPFRRLLTGNAFGAKTMWSGTGQVLRCTEISNKPYYLRLPASCYCAPQYSWHPLKTNF